jgi:DNA-directed RNA polymerase specialized sigma subunit
LERFIKLFNQKLENTPSNFLIEVENETDDEIKKIQEHLHQATMKEDLIRRLTLEKELENSYKTLEENFEKEREAKELAEKNAAEEKRLKEEALQKIERTIIKLYKKGFSLSEIAEDLEISEAEVQQALNKK